MCVCSVCVCKSMFVSVKYIYEQSRKTTMLGNIIVMGYKICMVMERLIPHSNVTDMIRLIKSDYGPQKGNKKTVNVFSFYARELCGRKYMFLSM